MKKIFALAMMFAITAQADPPLQRTVDFSGSVAPAIQVYQANTRTIKWTLRNNNAAFNGTGYTATMWIAESDSSINVVPATCAWDVQTNGTFTATFTPSQLNTNGSWIYGVGVSSNGQTEARIGSFVILRDPFASGAGAMTMGYSINWSNYTAYVNTSLFGPVRFGSGYTLTTNSDGSVSVAYPTASGVYFSSILGSYSDNASLSNALAAKQNTIAGTVVTNGADNAVLSNGAGYLTSVTNHTQSYTTITGLGSASTNNTGDFATAAQGTKADNWGSNSNNVFWLDGRYLGDRSAWGQNVSVDNIGNLSYGALQAGNNGSTMTIGQSAPAAIQRGKTAGSGAMTIGADSIGSEQVGVVIGSGIMDISDDYCYAGLQRGYVKANSIMKIAHKSLGDITVGAVQFGRVDNTAMASNSGTGSLQLFDLSGSQKGLMTGNASLGLGAVTVSNNQAIVAGDGQVSHGNGSISANSFYRLGTNTDLIYLGINSNAASATYSTWSGSSTNSLTATNAFQLGGVPAASYPTNNGSATLTLTANGNIGMATKSITNVMTIQFVTNVVKVGTGVIRGTNGFYFNQLGTNYWILLQ